MIGKSPRLGQPKGVLNTFGALRNRLAQQRMVLFADDFSRENADDFSRETDGAVSGFEQDEDASLPRVFAGNDWRQMRFSASASTSFIICLHEWLSPETVGGALLVFPPNIERDVDAFSREIDRQAVTVMHAVPSFLAPFLTALRRAREADAARVLAGNAPFSRETAVPRCGELRQVHHGGEASSWSLADLAREEVAGAQLVLLYGLTETMSSMTVCNVSDLCWRGSAHGDGFYHHPYGIPLGAPLGNVSFSLRTPQGDTIATDAR